MPIASSLLLEHFARLAATVTDAPMAIVSVIDRQSGSDPKSATIGVSENLLRIVEGIDAQLTSSSELMIIGDSARDRRFSSIIQAYRQHQIPRFLCHLKLVSPDGEPVGFICVLDDAPRSHLAEGPATSLGHIAKMVIADRQREQRHLHLMHVASRALRIDRMLRLVSESLSCADALTSLLEELCGFHKAVIGRIWQAVQSDKTMTEISRYDKDQTDLHKTYEMDSTGAISEIVVKAILCNEARAVDFSSLELANGLERPISLGLAGKVCVPIWVLQQRFGISLAFSTGSLDLEAILVDVRSLTDAI